MKRRTFLANSFAFAALGLFSTPSKANTAPPAPKDPSSTPTSTPHEAVTPMQAAPPEAKPEVKTAFYLSEDKIAKLSSLPVGQAFLFHYPLVCTPALLINLGQSAPPLHAIRYRIGLNEEGQHNWHGGAGPNQSIVAFSAICPHDLTYNTRELALMSYHHRKSGYYVPQDRVITCCSHGTAYDAAKGGQPIMGPAKKPLGSVPLLYDKAEGSFAPAPLQGYSVIPAFLNKHRKTLRRDFGKSYKSEAKGKIILTPLEKFSAKTVTC